MLELAIIGAGQLGSRHLQALANFRLDGSLTVVDPNPDSLRIAKSRFEENLTENVGRSIRYVGDLQALPEHIDLCIIACNSDVRRNVIESLVTHSSIRYLVAEKFLFQRLEDFKFVSDILEEHSVKTWVNCPMRMWSCYEYISAQMANDPIRQINVRGSRWGLATTLIHYVDLICFLTSNSTYQISNQFLQKKYVNSKRKGFIEFMGMVVGEVSTGTKFTISCYDQGKIPVIVEIICDSRTITLEELKGRVRVFDTNENVQKVTKDFVYPHQSTLTTIVVEAILNTGDCKLPTYEESAAIHMPILKMFLDQLYRIDGIEYDVCPVT